MFRLVAFRLVLLVVVLTVASPCIGAQAEPPQQSPPRQTSPEELAFRDARSAKDSAEQIKALTKFQKDYPESRYVTSGVVDLNLFIAACESSQSSVAEARRASAAWLAKQSQSADERAWHTFEAASRFLRAGLWTDAAEFARRSLEAWDSRKTTKPALLFRQELQRPAVLAVLGSALFEAGRTTEAKPILEEAFKLRAQEPGILAEIGPKLLKLAETDESKIDYLMTLALYGKLPPQNRGDLDQWWKSMHEGSLDGLEAALDRRYQAEVPTMVRAQAWTPAPTANRVALLETFTGTSCAPCAGVDLAVEAAIRRYGSSLVVLAYHQHVPAADPLANPSGAMREAYYGQSGVPTLVIDGKPLATQGGGSVTDAQQILDGRLRPPLEERLVVPAVGRLEITAPLARGVVTAKVTVTDAAGGSGPVTVMLALVEKQVRYSGGNGIRFHPMVVRKLVAAGRITNGGFAGRQTLDLKTIVRETQTLYGEYVKNNPGAAMLVLPEIDPANLMLVAFMQDDTTKEVLQSAIAPVVVGGR